jgi:hypothetical protein
MSSFQVVTADVVISENGAIKPVDNAKSLMHRASSISTSTSTSGLSNSNLSEIYDIPEPDLMASSSSIQIVFSELPVVTTQQAVQNISHPKQEKAPSRSPTPAPPLAPYAFKLQNEIASGDNLAAAAVANSNAMDAGLGVAAGVAAGLRPTSPVRPSSSSSSSSSSIVDVRTQHHHRRIKKHKTTIIDEDENKDTRIDYDDDDDDIKKIKSSLFNFVKDVAFNLIFTIPSLRSKLKPILNNPSLAINEIERQFDDFKDELNKRELENIKKYVCVEGIRDKLNYILNVSFKKIMEDGKIDINDAPQFIQLVYFIIHAFNEINDGEIFKFAVTKEHVMLLLHFVLKSVFCLTLDGEEEKMAISLLDTSFKLVKIEVCPLVSKKWYHRFMNVFCIFRKKKVLEDIQ